MPLLTILGSLGLGLVCGWLFGLFSRSKRVTIPGVLALVGAALGVGLEVWLFAGGWATAVFTCGIAGAWLVHFLWLRWLYQRFVEKADRQ